MKLHFWRRRVLTLEVDGACTLLVKYPPHLENDASKFLQVLRTVGDYGSDLVPVITVPRGIELQVIHGWPSVVHLCSVGKRKCKCI